MKNWDHESGDWRGLEDEKQRPRYQAIAAEILSRSATSVLDVGCGEAVLYSVLSNRVSYTGVEPSVKASALGRARGATVFTATAEEFSTQAPWDCVVFNEVLYYTQDPIGLLRKYSKLLAPSGFILVSIFQKQEKARWRNRLRHWMDSRRPISNLHCAAMVDEFMRLAGWAVLRDTIVTTNGLSWRIRAATPNSN